jgi:subtilisin family serine protease
VHKDQWINANQPPTTTGPCCGSTPVGTRSFFSSIGPTRDGRAKPDLAAPGEFVGSSLSVHDATPPGPNFRERDGRHHNMRGTSMAAPHVAGVAAALLALEPDLDAAEIADVLRRTSIADGNTGPVPNTEYGHGKLHALRAAFEASARVTSLSASATGFGARGHSQIPSYSVYRGDLASLPTGDYGACILSELATPSFNDSAVPERGNGFFYLAAGIYNDPVGDQPVIAGLGVDGSGEPRPDAPPCP